MNAPPRDPVQATLLERLESARAQQLRPFAALASELLHELSTPTPDWGRVFLLQIDLFEASVALLAFVNIAELSARATPLGSAREPLSRLRDGAKLSSGHWWSLLRETSRAVSASADPREPARLASALYFGGPRGRGEGAFRDELDRVPNLRNRVKGHAWTLPPEQYEAHARGLLKTTEAFLEAIDGFSRCTILHVIRCVAAPDGGFDVDARDLRGDPRRPLRRHLRADAALAPDRLHLVALADLEAERLTEAATIALHPFVQWRRAADGHEGLFVAQGLDEGGLDLASVVGGARITCPATLPEAQRVLDAMLARSTRGSTDLDALRARAAELARELLAATSSQASYDPRTYLVRPRIAQHLEEASAPADPAATGDVATRLAIISGPSGSGKTALCCHAAERWLLSARTDHLVAVARWSELSAAGGDVAIWWQQRFGRPLVDSARAASSAGATLRLYLDSVDRLARLDAFARQLEALVRTPELSSLRLSVTATDGVAGQLAQHFAANGLGHALYRWSVPPLAPSEAQALHQLLSDPSGPSAPLPDHVLPFLQSPLLVRLARALEAGGASGSVTPGRLLRAHADRTVLADPVRAHIAAGLVGRILATRSKVVPLAALLEDPELRQPLLLSGEDAPLRGLVRDHVLLLERAPSTSVLPMPAETTLAFTFDAQLDYLVFIDLARRASGDPGALVDLLADASPFGPLVGGLRVLFLESLHTESLAGAPLERLLRGLPEGLLEALVTEVLAAGVDPSPGGPFDALLAARAVPSRVLETCSEEAFGRLVVGGLLDRACGVAAMAFRRAGSPRTARLLARAVRMDAWSRDARSAITRARQLVEGTREAGPEVRVVALDALAFAVEQSGQVAEAGRLDEEMLAVALAAATPTGAEGAVWREARVALALATSRVAEARGDLAARDAAHEAALAAADGDAALACRTRLWVADELAARHDPGREARTLALALEALQAASELGDAAIEAHACEVVAHAGGEAAAAVDWVERGMLAAAATGCRGAGSRLLMRRARRRLAEARYEDARTDAHEAARAADEAGHRGAAMRMRLHVQLTACWELGLPGEMERLVRQIAEEASALEAPFERALTHLLDARIACELGDTARARRSLDELEGLRQRHRAAEKVHPGLIAGRLAWLESAAEHAFGIWQNAGTWGSAQRFADFIYQPAIAAARGRLNLARQTSDGEAGVRLREEAVDSLLEVLAEAPCRVGQRERYEGELAMLLAWGLFERGRQAEAEAWEQRALAWFKAHPGSLHGPEHHALVARRALLREEAASLAPKQRQNLLAQLLGQVGKHVVAPVRAQAATFDDPASQAAWLAHHPAIAHLRGCDLERAIAPLQTRATPRPAP